MYGDGDGETVAEDSPTCDPVANPRAARMLGAERSCLGGGGGVLRLAGLYTLTRGAHNYWLTSGKPVQGNPDGTINLLHYDDAAGACLAALKKGPKVVSGRTFLISDGHPTTRRGICESAVKAAHYRDAAIPEFAGGERPFPGQNLRRIGQRCGPRVEAAVRVLRLLHGVPELTGNSNKYY